MSISQTDKHIKSIALNKKLVFIVDLSINYKN